jgi:hypothetical protein
MCATFVATAVLAWGSTSNALEMTNLSAFLVLALARMQVSANDLASGPIPAATRPSSSFGLSLFGPWRQGGIERPCERSSGVAVTFCVGLLGSPT